MPCTRLVAVAVGPLLAASGALAQQTSSNPAPFERVQVTLPLAPSDPGFAAFRRDLGAVAKGRVFAELARKVVAEGFFWDRDFADGFDPKRSGVENLAAAIRLERSGGTGWQTLAYFAAEPTATKNTMAPDVLCAPGRPTFDQDAFDRLLDATRSGAAEWAFARAEQTALREEPRMASPVVETLGTYFVRVLAVDAAADDGEPLRTFWARVAAPSGKVGYAAPDTLMSPGAPQLCYRKDITGRWRIAGFVGGIP